jgi:hypothetical protein
MDRQKGRTRSTVVVDVLTGTLSAIVSARAAFLGYGEREEEGYTEEDGLHDVFLLRMKLN